MEQVSFDYVLFYDLDKNVWYKQKTININGEAPITRTRFCGETVYSKDTNTWEYVAANHLPLRFFLTPLSLIYRAHY